MGVGGRAGEQRGRRRIESRFLPPRCGFHFALPHSVALAFDEGDVGVMGESIEQGRDGSRIGKDGVPVLERLVGCNQKRTALVAAIDDFIEEVGGGRVIGQVADFIDGE